MTPIRVVIADDHPVVLRGLQSVFEAEPDFEIVATCQDGQEALRSVRAHRPDIVVVDLRMPILDGLAVLRQLKAEQSSTKVVLLVAELSDEDLLEASRLGVKGVVLKEMAPRLLVQCLRKVHAGEVWIERTSVARAFEALLRREAGSREIAGILTGREIEITRMVAAGRPNKTIAEALHISEGTVKTHLHHIFEKLHVESRAQLIAYCRDRGIS